MDGVGGYAGWRWIFILEGLLTVVVAFIAYFTIYDFPDTAGFLTEKERLYVIQRLKYHKSSTAPKECSQNESFQWKYVKAAFLDWQVYASLFG